MVDQNDIGTQNNGEVVVGGTDSSVPVQNVGQNQQIYSNPVQTVIQENVPQIQPIAQQMPQDVQQNVAIQPIPASQEKGPGKFMKGFIKFAAKVSGQPDPETGEIQSNTNQVNLNNQNNVVGTSQVLDNQEPKKSKNAFDSIMGGVTGFLDKVETKVEKVTGVDLDSFGNMPQSPQTVQTVVEQPQQVVQNTNPEQIQQPQQIVQTPVNTQTNDGLINQIGSGLNKGLEGSKNILSNMAGGVSNVVGGVPGILDKAGQKIENVTGVSLDSLGNMPTNPEAIQTVAQQPQQVVQNTNPEQIQQPQQIVQNTNPEQIQQPQQGVQTPVNTPVNAGLTSQVGSGLNKGIQGSRKIFNNIMGGVTGFLDKVEKKVEKVTGVNIDSLGNMPTNQNNIQTNSGLISKIGSGVSKGIGLSKNVINTAAGGVNSVAGGVGNVVGGVAGVLDKAEQKVVQTTISVLPNDGLIGQVGAGLNKGLEGSKNILSNVAGGVDSVAGGVSNVVGGVPGILDKAGQKIENVTGVNIDSLGNMPKSPETVQPVVQQSQQVVQNTNPETISQPQEVVQIPVQTVNAGATAVSMEEKKENVEQNINEQKVGNVDSNLGKTQQNNII